MGAMSRCLDALKTVFSSKVDEQTDELIQKNPKAFMEKNIETQDNIIAENELKLSEVHTILEEYEKQVKDKVINMKKIEALTRKYTNENNLEAVKQCNERYKLRRQELDQLEELKKSTKETYDNLFDLVKNQKDELEQYIQKKDQVLAKLALADSQEQVQGILAGVKKSNLTRDMEKTDKLLNKKINMANSRRTVSKQLNNSDSDFLKGL